MSISVRKDKRANGKEYYKLYEVKRVLHMEGKASSFS